jgi:hypothetical protein
MEAVKGATGATLSVLAHRREGAASQAERRPPVLHAAVGRRTLCGRRPLPEQGWTRVVHGEPGQVTCARCLRLM